VRAYEKEKGISLRQALAELSIPKYNLIQSTILLISEDLRFIISRYIYSYYIININKLHKLVAAFSVTSERHELISTRIKDMCDVVIIFKKLTYDEVRTYYFGAFHISYV
jgi:hypothetical protein